MNGVISTPVQFGVGDGTTSTFKLVPNPGEQIAQVVIANVWRNDWQGNQQLYPTPRTNLLYPSADFTNSRWSKSNATVTAGATTGPDGASPAAKLVESTGTGGHLARYTYQYAANTVYTAKLYLKAAERSAATFLFFATGGIASFHINLLTGEVLTGSTGLAGATCAVTVLGNGWYAVAVTATPTGSAPGSYFDIRISNQWPPTSNTGASYTGDGVSGIFISAGQLEQNGRDTSYIPTTTAPVTVTDYTLDPSGSVTLATAPVAGALLTWTGTYVYTPVDLPSTFPMNTVISQYANSPTLLQLIENFDQYIDPTADIDAFYDMVWNIDTAVGRGLDIWGKIVGLENGRLLKIPSAELNLGFKEAGNASSTPFGSGVFYSGSTVTENYYLSDDAFRTLILVKAMANISDGSIPSYNQLLQNLFKGRGRCYVNDLGNMQMRYTFEFYLEPFEVAILTQSGVMPRPTGVLATFMQVPIPNVFGFSEAGKTSVAPFGQGTFFTGVLNAS